MQIEINENVLKQVVKSAILEMIQEKNNLLHDIIYEALEDIALCRAIGAERDSESTSRESVFDILGE